MQRETDSGWIEGQLFEWRRPLDYLLSHLLAISVIWLLARDIRFKAAIVCPLNLCVFISKSGGGVINIWDCKRYVQLANHIPQIELLIDSRGGTQRAAAAAWVLCQAEENDQTVNASLSNFNRSVNFTTTRIFLSTSQIEWRAESFHDTILFLNWGWRWGVDNGVMMAILLMLLPAGSV